MLLTNEVLASVFKLAKEYVEIIIDEIRSKVMRDADVWEAMERLFHKQALCTETPSDEEMAERGSSLAIIHDALVVSCCGEELPPRKQLPTFTSEYSALQAFCRGTIVGQKSRTAISLLSEFLAKSMGDGTLAAICDAVAHWLLAWGSNAQVERDVKALRDAVATKNKQSAAPSYVEDMVLLRSHLARVSVADEIIRDERGHITGLGPFLMELYRQWESLRAKSSFLTKRHHGPEMQRRLGAPGAVVTERGGRAAPPGGHSSRNKRLPDHLEEETVSKQLRADGYAAQDYVTLRESPVAAGAVSGDVNWEAVEG